MVDEAAAMLKVTATTVLKWIRNGRLTATQLCPNAPWVLRQSDVEALRARLAAPPPSHTANGAQLAFDVQ
jgi:excisionase family DNA binding protein